MGRGAVHLPMEIQDLIATFPKTQDLAADVVRVLSAFGQEMTGVRRLALGPA